MTRPRDEAAQAPSGTTGWRSSPAHRRPVGLTIAWMFTLAAFAYCWILPLIRPRGPFGWGHYTMSGIYAGVIVGVLTLVVTVAALSPAAERARRTFRLSIAVLTFLGTLAAWDLFHYWYAVVRPGTNYWFTDRFAPSEVYLPDSELGFRARPHALLHPDLAEEHSSRGWRLDAHGFRNPSSRDRADIVFLGDSATLSAALPKPEIFTQLVEEQTGLLSANLAVIDYGPAQELAVLRRFGLEYRPRYVIWQISEGSDLVDTADYTAWRAGRPNPAPLRLRLFQHSLYSRQLMSTYAPTGEGPHLRSQDGSRQEWPRGNPYRPEIGPSDEPALASIEATLRQGQQVCAEHDIRLLVLFVPLMVRVLAPHMEYASIAERDRYLPGGRTGSQNDFSSRLSAFSRRNGIAVLDVYPALAAAEARDNRDLFLRKDNHLGRAAQVVIAESVSEWILGRAARQSGKDSR